MNDVETVLINEDNRDGFNSKIGFILACIGSAVGMGNIWMFPYRVGQFGGAAFLIPYFTFVLLIGFSGVIGEMTLGRSMKTVPLGAFEKAFKQRGLKGGTIIGFIPIIVSLAIAIGYAIVIGWILRYSVSSLLGTLMTVEAGPYFGILASDFGSIPWHIAVLFAGVTSLMNLFETPIEALQSKLGLSRRNSIAVVAIIAFFVGVFLHGDSLSPWMDFVSIYVIPLGALLAGIVIYWVCKPGFAREQAQMGREKIIGAWFEPITKYFFCGIAILVYIMGIFYG
ncbi:MAG: hypothetical protein ACRCU6_06910 [Fusobacteriaceae bacterium]